MARVVTFGEAMLRLSPPTHQRLEQARTFDVWPAGSELNVAIGLARLGTPAAWVSVLPRTGLGRLVAAHAAASGVDASHVRWEDGGRLGLYFVEVAAPPRPTSALYDRARSCFATLDPAVFDWPAILDGAGAFHVSGITPALSEGCARATEAALAAAKAAGCQTSYDVNLRRRLTTPERARTLLEAAAPSLDLVFCSAADAETIFGVDDAEELRGRLRVPLVVVTEHGNGDRLRIAVGDETETVRGHAYEATDPIGGGDAFCAGFLHGFLGDGVRRGLELGEAAAALALTIPGDAPLVERDEVEAVAGGAETRVAR